MLVITCARRDGILGLFVLQYATQAFLLDKHLYSLTTYACTTVPILSAFVSNRRSFVVFTASVGCLLTANFLRCLKQQAPPLDIDDIEGLYTLLMSVAATAVLAQIYVTQVQKNFLALAQSAGHIEQINLAKTVFIANISHELRTPLHAILAAASFINAVDLTTVRKYDQDFFFFLMKGAIKKQEQKMFVNTILTCGDTIKALVSNILDLSRMETDMLEWNCQTFNLIALVEEIAGSFALFAHNKNIYLQVNMTIEPPFRWQFVYSDKIRLKKILTNVRMEPTHPPPFFVLLLKPSGFN